MKKLTILILILSFLSCKSQSIETPKSNVSTDEKNNSSEKYLPEIYKRQELLIKELREALLQINADINTQCAYDFKWKFDRLHKDWSVVVHDRRDNIIGECQLKEVPFLENIRNYDDVVIRFKSEGMPAMIRSYKKL